LRDKLKNKNGEFYEWLRRQHQRTDVVGDFVRFVFWDRDVPKKTDDPNKWRDYCRGRSYPFLVAGFEQSWMEYQHKNKRTIL
jgi:uncharacterized protein YozE (UPF0346 family)